MKLLFLGDYCLGNEDQEPVLSPSLERLFQESDLICVNFEGPIGNTDTPPAPKTGPAIRQSSSAAKLCEKWGITHYSLANNHIFDFGSAGLHSTLKTLGPSKCLGAGPDFDRAYQPLLYESNGLKIAMLSYSEAQFGVLQDDIAQTGAGYAWADHPRARESIKSAREVADWVIVQVHAGLEMEQLPLPEWRQRYREMIDLGADLIVGHHPHVIQGSERYKDRDIHYSLGNFYMDTMLRQADPGSGAALVVDLDSNSISSRLVPLATSLSEISIEETGASMAHYNKLCETLDNPAEYYAAIDKICLQSWETIYSRYYRSALTGMGLNPNVKNAAILIAQIFARVLLQRRAPPENELMLLHNIRIESHRWAVERAMRLKSGQ